MSEQVPMIVGGGAILAYVRDEELTWMRCLKEWLDNALDAQCTRFEVVKKDSRMTVKDDGIGCAEPDRLVSLGGSHAHGAGRRAGYFGMGGTIASIRASQGGFVQYTTIHAGECSIREANWGQMIAENSLRFSKDHRRVYGGERGTTIEIHSCRRFKDLDKIVRDLGFFYAPALEQGLDIVFKIDGQRKVVKPYQPPRLDDKKDFAFEIDGYPVTGWCGVVSPGEKNPHCGWTFYWGPHRTLGTFTEPAEDACCSSIYGEVRLPDSWMDHPTCGINVTKDGFSNRPDDLYERISIECREIIDAAQKAEQHFELNDFAERLSHALNELDTPGVKGRRPGDAGKSGTAKPTGNGKPHKNFNTSQDGDNAPREPQEAVRKFVVDWSCDEGPWKVVITQGRGRNKTFYRVRLNPECPSILDFHDRKDIKGLATFCILLISQQIKVEEKKGQLQLPLFEDMAIGEVFLQLTGGMMEVEEVQPTA